MKWFGNRVFVLSAAVFFISAAVAGEHRHNDREASICEGFGPQTPRNIDQKDGANERIFALAPSYEKMNLCNIHFHNNAEHMAEDFSIYAGKGEHGHGGGYECKLSKTLSEAEMRPPAEKICKGLNPGDTIEVHWVYTSCDVEPGKGLGSCLTDACANPNLRVEAQVFTLVNDSSAPDFGTFDYRGGIVEGYHQANSLPTNTGAPVVFLGSTTGPKYTEQECSPLQVTWSVRPKCSKVNIHSVGKWCGRNVFEEDHAHGVRELVTSPGLLSTIK